MSLNRKIYKKLRICRRADWERYRKFEEKEYITTEWVVAQIVAQKGACSHCKQELALKDWSPSNLRQFSIDRIKDSVAHTKSNCRITCLGCNWLFGRRKVSVH